MSTITLPPPIEGRLRFLEDTLDAVNAAYRSGRVTRDQSTQVFLRLDDEARILADELPPPTECPAWCNAHNTTTSLLDVSSHHRHLMHVLGSTFEVELDDDDVPQVLLTQGDECTLA